MGPGNFPVQDSLQCPSPSESDVGPLPLRLTAVPGRISQTSVTVRRSHGGGPGVPTVSDAGGPGPGLGNSAKSQAERLPATRSGKRLRGRRVVPPPGRGTVRGQSESWPGSSRDKRNSGSGRSLATTRNPRPWPLVGGGLLGTRARARAHSCVPTPAPQPSRPSPPNTFSAAPPEAGPFGHPPPLALGGGGPKRRRRSA